MNTKLSKQQLAILMVMMMYSSKRQRKKIAAFIMFAATFHPKLYIKWNNEDSQDALKAQSVHDKTAASTWMAALPNLVAALAAYQTAIDDWLLLIAKAENGNKQDKINLEVFSANFKSIKSARIIEMAQGVADANVTHAEQVAVSCDMELKGKGGRSSQEWSVTRVAAGSVELSAVVKAYGSKRYAVQWQRSQTPLDSASWYLMENAIIPTPNGKTIVSDLELTKLMYFRYRIISREDVSDWSYIISIVIS